MTEGGEALEGENVLPDVNIDIEGDLIMRSEIERLIQAVAQLTDDDQNIIRQFFLTQEPISELEYSKINGISQQAAHKRKKAVLKKLKEILCEQSRTGRLHEEPSRKKLSTGSGQPVTWMPVSEDVALLFKRHMCVNLRRCDGTVSEKLLNITRINVFFQQKCGK